MNTQPEKTVMIFVTDGNKVLLHKRLNTWFGNNQFAPPGGLVDEGESAEEAVIRELIEETNIQTSTDSLYLIEKDTSQGQGRHFENFYYHTTVWSGDLRITEPNRHSDLDWYEISNLPSATMPLVENLITKLKLN